MLQELSKDTSLHKQMFEQEIMRAFSMWYRFVSIVHRNLSHVGELPILLCGLKAL